MKCIECKFYVNRDKDPEPQGNCHRYPPQGLVVQGVSPLGQPTVNFICNPPVVSEEYWCGEFTANSR